MQRRLPDPEDRFQKREIEVVKLLGETSQGILMLHHAVLAYKGWQPWSDICGIEDRALRSEREHPITITPANPDHPVTKEMGPWEMVDETYMMDEPGEDCEPLLTTDDPHSMTTLGWTRQHGRSRVMVYTGGHSRIAYNTPEFRTVVVRGIQWLAGETIVRTRAGTRGTTHSCRTPAGLTESPHQWALSHFQTPRLSICESRIMRSWVLMLSWTEPLHPSISPDHDRTCPNLPPDP